MSKVVQINTVSNYGSTGKIVEAIGLLAHDCGWNSKIAVGGRYSQPSKLETYQISNVFQNYLSAIHSYVSGHHGFANRYETAKFLRWLNNENPDIVHLHNIHSYILNVGLLFNFLSQKKQKVIWTLHDCWPFTGHCSHFIQHSCYKWQTGCYDCPAIHGFPKSLLFDRSQPNYDEKKTLFNTIDNMIIVTVSNWLAECVRSSFLGNYNVMVIPNGVDLDIFKPNLTSVATKFGLERKKIVLGVSTSWCNAKGLGDYLQLRKLLPQDYVIVLIGMTKEQVKKYSAPGFLCIEKTNSLIELVEWYNAAHVILNLSYAETFGLPVAEGFACGKPAIVYDNTALTELITTGTGYKAASGDVCRVKELILNMNEENDETYLYNCRSRAENLYDKKKNYNEYLTIYKSMMETTCI